MPDHKGDIDGGAALLDPVEVLGEAQPVPGNALLECFESHALDLGHHVLEVLAVGCVAEWRERETTVAGHHRGDPEEV